MVILVAVTGGLVFLLAVSVYSAIVLGKRTDRITAMPWTDESARPVMNVRFPKEVFRRGRAVWGKR